MYTPSDYYLYSDDEDTATYTIALSDDWHTSHSEDEESYDDGYYYGYNSDYDYFDYDS